MELTEEEVLQILKIMDESHFDQLHLEIGELKLSVSKSGTMERFQEGPQKPAVPVSRSSGTSEAVPAAQKAGALDGQQRSFGNNVLEEGLVPITAPLMGVFYSRPDPDSPPYVEVGKIVAVDDTIGLIEIMKLFNSVKASVPGTIARICVESGQLVEYGQPLFLVKPPGAGSGSK
ncbi:MAG: biotin/lipoyl-containing protein [Desulfobacterales bacterium]|nr:biotin/lipoyl-containing protein [Desulfobacterales bacterium]